LVRARKQPGATGARSAVATKAAGPQGKDLVEELQRKLGTKVRLEDRGGKGTLEIDFFSYEDLDRLLAFFRR
jgi:ParB family transcriptional regulator, chromosome partitioning protein